jgi:uncharacterized integral membrane protein
MIAIAAISERAARGPFFFARGARVRISTALASRSPPMQAIVWIVRLLIVLLHGVLDQVWEAPLVFVLLVAFVAGLLIGLLAWVPTVMRHRREIGRLRKSAAQLAARPAPPMVPGTEPPGVDGQAHGL